MKFPALKDIEGKLAAKQTELATLFADAKNESGELDHTKIKGFSSGSELAEAVRTLNTELDELGAKRDEMAAVLKGAERAEHDQADEIEPGDVAAKGGRQAKSIGDLFAESDAFKLKAGSNLSLIHI